jgi:hypothetical protein
MLFDIHTVEGIPVGEGEAPEPPDERVLCVRCGGVMELVTIIGRFADQAAYKIFECVKTTRWVAHEL